MQITAEMVKNLREATGAGLMDCRKALTEAGGDEHEAEKILKKMGLASVAKRADRATENGRIAAYSADKACVLVSIACETDFVARNEDFRKMCDEVAKTAAEQQIKEPNAVLEDKVKALISVIKENMAIKKLSLVPLASNECAETYIHNDGAMGVAVKFKSDKAEAFANPEVKTLMHDIALHVAAYQPQYLCEKDIDEKYKAEQEEIFKAQVASLDKPDKVKEGIVKGKLNKLKDEICLLNQGFVKDPTISVEKIMQDTAKKAGCTLSVVEYHYMKAGV